MHMTGIILLLLLLLVGVAWSGIFTSHTVGASRHSSEHEVDAHPDEDADPPMEATGFERSSIVHTRRGPLAVSSLRIGDEVLAFNSDQGRFEYSRVLTFLDRDPLREDYFVNIKSADGCRLRVTRYQLVYRQEYEDAPSVTYAIRILPGDTILTKEAACRNASEGTPQNGTGQKQQQQRRQQRQRQRRQQLDELPRQVRVASIEFIRSRGIYAPLTSTGNIVVNGVLTSCYALINDHELAHGVFGPLRFFAQITSRGRSADNQVNQDHNNNSKKEAPNTNIAVDSYTASFRGVHWYAKRVYQMFRSLFNNYMP